MAEHSSGGQRSLSYPGFAAVVVIYLVIIQAGGKIAQSVADVDSGDLSTTKAVVVTLWIPLGAALIFTYGVIAWLGWWRPVLREERRVQPWVIVVPVIFIIGILAAIDYSALSEKSVGYVLALFLATQMVGWGEEGMFRGIGVTTLRERGLREGQVALWSSAIFGAVHLSNVLTRGVGALPQAIIVSLAGYFFYLTRRRAGTNAVNSVLHGLFDFSLLTGTVILVDQDAYLGSIAAILVYVVVTIVLLVRRKHIEPVG